MGRESFERSIQKKFEGQSLGAPKRLWEGIDAKLNEQALNQYQASHKKYRLAVAAAILIALISFAYNSDWHTSDQQLSDSEHSFNALRGSGSGYSSFYKPKTSVNNHINYKNYWSKIVFVDRDQRTAVTVPSTDEVNGDLYPVTYTPTFELFRKSPSVEQVSLDEVMVSPYYVAQYRSTDGKNDARSDSRTFWAGLEAGTGNFSPEFSGSNPLNTAPNFETIANTLGQNEFVNPSSNATQTDMEDGVVTSFGVDFGMKMGKKWTLESGFQYAQFNNSSTASVNVIDIYTVSNPLLDGDIGSQSARQTQIENEVDHTVDLENTTTFTSIPLKAGYFLVDKKVSLRLNAGITANYFLNNQLNDPTGQLQSSNNNGLYNEWSFDGLTGIELGYSIFNNVNLTFEPNYIQSITPLSSSLINRSGFMVQTGLRYNIR